MPGFRDRAWIGLKYGRIRGLSGALVRRCLRPLVRWHTVLFAERDLTTPVPEVSPKISAEIRLLTEAEICGFRPVFESQGLPWGPVEKRLARGDRCAAALFGDRLLHYQWMTFSSAWIPELQARLCLSPGDVYGYGAATLPEFRGNNLHPAVIAFVMAYARARGCQRHLSYVCADNRWSRRAALKVHRDRRCIVRRIEIIALRGALVIGAERAGCPELAFPETVVVRRLGRIGLRITPGGEARLQDESQPGLY